MLDLTMTPCSARLGLAGCAHYRPETREDGFCHKWRRHPSLPRIDLC
jgi:hypothetical protein